MSRVGKKKIDIPAGVSVSVTDKNIQVKGPKGQLELDLFPGIDVKVADNAVEVSNTDTSVRILNAMHGTMRSHISNMITGVSQGFVKEMQIYGTGYNVKTQGNKLVLAIGFCHTVDMEIPKGISVDIKVPATRGNEVPAAFSISGIDKQQLGQFAAVVRGVRPPEPYIGKGIRYADETVLRKVGKAFGA